MITDLISLKLFLLLEVDRIYANNSQNPYFWVGVIHVALASRRVLPLPRVVLRKSYYTASWLSHLGRQGIYWWRMAK